MPSNQSSKPSAGKIYKANPAPVKDSDFSKTGWDGPGKKELGDNRDLKEAPKD